MNHVKPEFVKVRLMDRVSFFSCPFWVITWQKYSEEDLDVNGDLVLNVDDFEKFLRNYLKEVR